VNGTRLPDGDDIERDVAAHLAAWMASEAPPRARPELLASTLARTSAIARPRSSRWPIGALIRPLAMPGRLALVLLLVAALSGAAVLGVGSRLLLRTTPAPTPVPTLPSVAPSIAGPFASPIPLQSVTTMVAAGGATIGDVTLGGSGLLAVGSVTSGSSVNAAVWTSPDGTGWMRVSAGAAMANASVLRIASRGSAFVAIGLDCPPNAQGTCGPAKAWTSPDGARWTPASTTFGGPSQGGLDYGFQAIVQGGPGYVMLGGADQADPYGGTYLGPVVTTSKDGSQWTIRRLTGPSFDRTSFAGIANNSANGFVAVGATVALLPVAWTSPDGTTWQPVATSTNRIPFTGAVRLNDVAAGPGGYVAVGQTYGPSAGVWVSVDGREWSLSHYQVSFKDTEMTRIVWTGTSFLAMGKTSAGDGLAWVSRSGLDWTPIDTASAFRGAPIVAGDQVGQRIVLFGQDAPGQIVVAWAAAP
jgi:hypothetical protein